MHAAPGEAGATLVDSGHVNHAEQTLALVRQALGGQPLARIVNTHLHSDHCGGNATLQRAFGAVLYIPPGLAEAVHAWDHTRLSFEATGQRIDRFVPQGVIRPGDVLRAGGRAFEVLPAPGHDPESVMLFDAAGGLLVSADALWEFGFGVVFPEMEGEPGFDDVAAVLDAIERLPVALVVPGHGTPFTDVAAALARSRARLAAFQADPGKHARHGVKVLIKYHLMEERTQPIEALPRVGGRHTAAGGRVAGPRPRGRRVAAGVVRAARARARGRRCAGARRRRGQRRVSPSLLTAARHQAPDQRSCARAYAASPQRRPTSRPTTLPS